MREVVEYCISIVGMDAGLFELLIYQIMYTGGIQSVAQAFIIQHKFHCQIFEKMIVLFKLLFYQLFLPIIIGRSGIIQFTLIHVCLTLL